MLRHWAIFNKLPPDQLIKIKHIHVFEGGRSALYITSGDIVYAIGTNGPYNLLGLSGREKCNLVVEPENVERLSLKSIYTIAVGDFFGVANNTNGELYHWGRRMDKRRGILLPHQVKCPHFVTDIACGSEFFVILTKEQRVFFRGSFQQNDHPVAEFTEVTLETGVSYVSCGIYHLALLGADGQVYTCGYDHNATYRSWKSEDGLVPKRMELKEHCVQVVCGRRSTVCVMASGSVWACGENDNLGVESENSVMKHPARVKIPEPIRQLAATWCSNIYAASAWNGKIFSWGYKTRWPTPLTDACVMLDAFHNRETPSNLGMIPVAPQLSPGSSFNAKTVIRESLPVSYEIMKRLERSLSADDLSVSNYPVDEEAPADRNNDAVVPNTGGRRRSGTQTTKPKNLPPGLGLLISAGKYLATRPSDRQTNRRRAVSPEAHPAKVPKPAFSVAAGSSANLASSANTSKLTRDRSQSMENLDSQGSSTKKKPRVLSVIFGLNAFDTGRKTPLASPQTETPPRVSQPDAASRLYKPPPASPQTETAPRVSQPDAASRLYKPPPASSQTETLRISQADAPSKPQKPPLPILRTEAPPKTSPPDTASKPHKPLVSPVTESPVTSQPDTPSTPGYLTPNPTNPFDPRKDIPVYPEIPLPLDGNEVEFYKPNNQPDDKPDVIHAYNPFLYDPITAVEFKFPTEAARCYADKTKTSFSSGDQPKTDTHKNNPGTKVLLEYYTVLADIKTEMSELKNIVNELADIISNI